MAPDEPITEMLNRAVQGDGAAADRVMAILYDELRSIARAQLKKSPVRVSLPPTDLVHEAYLRLAGRDGGWESRGHFLRLCARVMRGALVDHARRRNAQRRGGGKPGAPLHAAALWFETRRWTGSPSGTSASAPSSSCGSSRGWATRTRRTRSACPGPPSSASGRWPGRGSSGR